MDKESVQEEGRKDIITRALDFRKLKKENFVVIFLIGMLLLVIAWPTGGDKKENSMSQSGILDGNESIMKLSGETAGETAAADTPVRTRLPASDELYSYRISLESALEELLSGMEGAGRVKVMITLRSFGEAVVEKDFTSGQSSSSETDSEGGSRIQRQSDRTGETVYTSGSGGVSVPYVKQVLCPEIEGVIVCAQGGGNPSVNKNITEAIQALFGIEAHKIKVIKMSSK